MCNLRHKKENISNYEEYCYKSVTSGKYVEIYIYYDKIFKRRTEKSKELLEIINSWDITVNEKKGIENSEEKMNVEDVKEEIFEKVKKDDVNVRRSQRRLRRIINSNLGQYQELDKFLTLTFPKLKSREKACRAFKTFIKNLRYNYGDQIEYIAVMEIQDGGRLEDASKATGDIHFHVLLFNCPYIPQDVMQNKIWKHGIVDIRKIEMFGDVANYLANYLSKDDLLCVKGKRSYFPSRGLFKPLEKIGMDESLLIEEVRNLANEIQFSSEYYVENVGRIGYIKLKKKDLEKNNDHCN